MHWQWPGWWAPHFEARGEVGRKPASRWWHLVGGDGSYVSWRSPTVPWLLFTKEKNGECHHDGREWVMSQYCDGLLLPGDWWPPEEFDLRYFWWSEVFFMNQVLSHIIAWNETMGNRGAVTLRWSMGEWTELITSRDVLLHFTNTEFQLLFRVVLMTWGFSSTMIITKLFLTSDNSYISWRRHASDKCIERFSSCLDWEKL